MSRAGEVVYVIPYSVADTPEARQEAIRTGNCIRTRIHGSRLPPYRPSGMRIHFHENGEVTWEPWDGTKQEEET